MHTLCVYIYKICTCSHLDRYAIVLMLSIVLSTLFIPFSSMSQKTLQSFSELIAHRWPWRATITIVIAAILRQQRSTIGCQFVPSFHENTAHRDTLPYTSIHTDHEEWDEWNTHTHTHTPHPTIYMILSSHTYTYRHIFMICQRNNDRTAWMIADNPRRLPWRRYQLFFEYRSLSCPQSRPHQPQTGYLQVEQLQAFPVAILASPIVRCFQGLPPPIFCT